MPNQNYAQVMDLYNQGKLNWVGGSIMAVLYTGLVQNPADHRISDLHAPPLAIADINGRSMTIDGKALGLPATFQRVGVGGAYQVVVVLDDGPHDPLLLSFIDTDMGGNSLTVLRPGSLMVRPIEAAPPPTVGSSALPPTVGVWMALPVPVVTPLSEGAP